MRQNTLPKDFESAFSELEATVAKMESGQLPLDQSLAAYQRGTELLRHCQQILAETEQQIRVLDENQNLKPLTEDE